MKFVRKNLLIQEEQENYLMFSILHCRQKQAFLAFRGGATISKVRGLRKTYFSKVLSLVSPAGPTMVGAKGSEKILNSKGSRSSENATFFEYFLINSLLLNETVF